MKDLNSPPGDLTLRQAVGRIEACLYATFGHENRSEGGEVPLATNVVDALIMVATSRQIAAQTIAEGLHRIADAIEGKSTPKPPPVPPAAYER